MLKERGEQKGWFSKEKGRYKEKVYWKIERPKRERRKCVRDKEEEENKRDIKRERRIHINKKNMERNIIGSEI